MRYLYMFLFMFMQVESSEATKKWAVYYGENVPNDIFAPYSLLILEGDQRPDVDGLLEDNKIVLGYLSLGEVSKDRPYFKALDKEGVLLGTNPHWPDSRFVDVRSKVWTKMVIEELIPALLFQHFSGIFLDTVDNPPYLEDKDPVLYKGMKDALIKLIRTIRLHYPTMPIMMNRGFEVLPEVAKEINMVLAESILASKGKLLSLDRYQESVNQLKEAQKINPKLQVYTLDYWPASDALGVKKIYEMQRKEGFIPYVANVELNQVFPEPL